MLPRDKERSFYDFIHGSVMQLKEKQCFQHLLSTEIIHVMVKACNPPPSSTFLATEQPCSNQVIAAMMNKNSMTLQSPGKLLFSLFFTLHSN